MALVTPDAMTNCYLAVDATDRATVAVGVEKVADLAHITVQEYPATGVEDVLRRFLTEEAVDPENVLCVVVVDSLDDSTGLNALKHRIVAALGHGPLLFIERREATLRGLEAAPEAAASALAVLPPAGGSPRLGAVPAAGVLEHGRRGPRWHEGVGVPAG